MEAFETWCYKKMLKVVELIKFLIKFMREENEKHI